MGNLSITAIDCYWSACEIDKIEAPSWLMLVLANIALGLMNA